MLTFLTNTEEIVVKLAVKGIVLSRISSLVSFLRRILLGNAALPEGTDRIEWSHLK